MDFLYNEIVIGGGSMFFKRNKKPAETKPAKVLTEEEMKNLVRMHIVFYGTVQGVGFRFKAMMAADKLGITGWVKNDNDHGTVIMEAQGPEKRIYEMIEIFQKDRFIQITDYDITFMDVDPSETDFTGPYN
jgi:acylphosphatase